MKSAIKRDDNKYKLEEFTVTTGCVLEKFSKRHGLTRLYFLVSIEMDVNCGPSLTSSCKWDLCTQINKKINRTR